MEKELNYKEIYTLQDQVLKIIFSNENIFYLTGGTCLNRFYVEKRFSEDLDLFTNMNPRFYYSIKNIEDKLSKNFEVKKILDEKSFVRLIINNILQVDFVNDVEYRYGDIVLTEKGFLIDNVFNILSNKITAIIGRDNPKDIFDMYLISKFYSFSWNDILEAAHKKFVFNDDEFLVRLKSFPKELLNNLVIFDKDFLKNFEKDFVILIDEIYYKKCHNKLE